MEPLKLGRGELFLQPPGASEFDALPFGTAEGLEITGDFPKVGEVGKIYSKALKAAKQTIRIIGLEYNLENLLRLGYISIRPYRRFHAIERQRHGEKVFYPRRRRRSMKGK